MSFDNWEDFFKDIPFTFFRTSIIQEKYINTILDEVKDLKKTSDKIKILEIAGGSGYTSAVLNDLFKHDDSVDVIYSDLSYKLCQEATDKFGLKHLVIDSEDIFADFHDFDIIFHQGFLEHFNDKTIVGFLQEQSRVAKIIVFDIPNDRRDSKIQEFGNERFLSNDKWFSLVGQADLNITKITGRRFTNWWKKYVPKVIYDSEFFHTNFGESTIIVCKSPIYDWSNIKSHIGKIYNNSNPEQEGVIPVREEKNNK